MSDWYNHPNVFIRSLATRGSLGGLHPKIIEISDLLKAAPFDYIIVETVGVGQSEIEIAGLADITIVTVVPEAGDEIQTMKAGLMEIADIFVVNKSDRPDADTHCASHAQLHRLPSPLQSGRLPLPGSRSPRPQEVHNCAPQTAIRCATPSPDLADRALGLDRNCPAGTNLLCAFAPGIATVQTCSAGIPKSQVSNSCAHLEFKLCLGATPGLSLVSGGSANARQGLSPQPGRRES